MLDIPLIAPTLVVGFVALVDWTRSAVVARFALGAAFTMLLCAVRDPGMSASEILAYYDDGLTYMLAVARVMGLGCLLFCASRVLRELAT